MHLDRKRESPIPKARVDTSSSLDLTDLDELALSGVCEGGEEVSVLLDGVIRVEDVDAEVAERRPEVVLLGAVLEQGRLQRV